MTVALKATSWRIPRGLWRRARVAAIERDETLSAFVREAIHAAYAADETAPLAASDRGQQATSIRMDGVTDDELAELADRWATSKAEAMARVLTAAVAEHEAPAAR